ncbi:MAG: hypothetical protein ABSE63_19065 [Thermoguttaceae bacterium]|jgi:hypothetical protein
MTSHKTNLTPDDSDKSAKAFKELIRVLEAAVWLCVDSVELEWKGQDLLVFHGEGNAATTIAKELQLDVLGEIVKRAKLLRKHKGYFRIRLLGQEYTVVVEETITLVNQLLY